MIRGTPMFRIFNRETIMQFTTPISKAFLVAALATANSAFANTQPFSSLTLFHNNDGESKLFGDANFGGAAYFKTTLEGLRVQNAGRDQLTISSGDNFLAGLAFNASLTSGPIGSRTYYDAMALQQIGYDAITIGNHDFDFGPQVLADFITFYNGQGGTAPFLSANLNFSGESTLQSLVDTGSIAKSTIVTKNGNQYGIIGVTTETLPNVSSPGNVTVNPVLSAIQAEVTSLESQGINKIILSSHLQAIGNELALIPQLKGIDVVIAGGGDELLLNADNTRNTVAQRSGQYPLTAQDADGKNVAVVTTVGEYLYVGKLDVEFDGNGEVVNVSGNPVVVDKNAVSPDPGMQASVIDPLSNALAAANAQQVATTNVFLEHSDGNTNGPRVIRQRETNLGNLVADAFVWAVQNENKGLTEVNRLLGLTNSGGIREDLDNNENGLITQGEVQAVLPFQNSMAVIGNVNVPTLIAALENSVSRIQASGTGTDGRFAQISGFEFDYDRNRTAGSRIIEVRLADGTKVWSVNEQVNFEGLFDIATNSFLAGSGTPDGYNFGTDVTKTILTTGYADALLGYIQLGLNGVITADAYPISGSGRINPVPVPAAAWLLGTGILGLAGFRRRSTDKA
jgi:5'-nucleotidase / UDP-sugar diphosphatase